jgi:hypothetical protein
MVKCKKPQKSAVKDYTLGKIIFLAVALLATIYLVLYLVKWAQEDSGPQPSSSIHSSHLTV